MRAAVLPYLHTALIFGYDYAARTAARRARNAALHRVLHRFDSLITIIPDYSSLLLDYCWRHYAVLPAHLTVRHC